MIALPTTAWRTLTVWVLALCVAFPSVSTAQQVGPENGALVIVGGAMRSPAIMKRFLDLAGGANARIVVIPTAGGAEEYGPNYPGLRAWRDQGALNLTVLHTTDPNEANTAEFAAVIDEADGVWFAGGRQWRLADSYLGTETEEALWRLLDRGGVIGGSSAGATIQGSYLARGDTRTNTVMMGDHEEGFGFLRNTAIDQHVLRRNRQFDLIEIIEARPELLGIGIDENTAIVVQGDRFTVMGEGYVLIYDHQTTVGPGGQFYFLAPGDRFDLVTREAFRPAERMQPLGGLQRVPWRSDGRRRGGGRQLR
jgi:cyanophycinase